MGRLRADNSSSDLRYRRHNRNHDNCGTPNVSEHRRRRACGFYVWNAPSAILYKWCHYLLKDHIYEGRGGYLFVRFESNSILQLLFPCDRHSPNKCAICGGSFPDHLDLWWSKHLYSPFDQFLDKTYNDAINVKEADEVDAGRISSSSRSKNRGHNPKCQPSKSKLTSHSPTAETKATAMSGPPLFSFHKKYVTDVTDLVRGMTSGETYADRIRKHMIKTNPANTGRKEKRRKQTSSSSSSSSDGLSGLFRRLVTFSKKDNDDKNNSQAKLIPPPPPNYNAYRLKRMRDADVSYLVPVRGSNMVSTVKDKFMDVIISLSLWSVDDMIHVQGIENRLLKRYGAPKSP